MIDVFATGLWEVEFVLSSFLLFYLLLLAMACLDPYKDTDYEVQAVALKGFVGSIICS